jgi:hypothetical protein
MEMNQSVALSEQQRFEIVLVTDPVASATALAQYDMANRNWAWLRTRLSELGSGNLGRYLCVAGQEPFIADTPEEARKLAKSAHPEDLGIITYRFRTTDRPMIYAN